MASIYAQRHYPIIGVRIFVWLLHRGASVRQIFNDYVQLTATDWETPLAGAFPVIPREK